MEKLVVLETDKHRWAVRPIDWCRDTEFKMSVHGGTITSLIPDHENHYAVFWKKEDAEFFVKCKEAEEQERLRVLPCKVGDIIYSLGTRCNFGEIPDGGCDEIDCEDCYCGKEVIMKETTAKDFHIMRFMAGKSKYTFLTKEEAEKALAEMKGQ